jgi:hypothetical protein
MPDYPSEAPTPELSAAFVTRLPTPRRLVYDYVKAAAARYAAAGRPALSSTPTPRARRRGRKIDVVRGWPAYPGKVPAIGVGAGPRARTPRSSRSRAASSAARRHDSRRRADRRRRLLRRAALHPRRRAAHPRKPRRARPAAQPAALVLTPLRTLLPDPGRPDQARHVDMIKDELLGRHPPADRAAVLIYQITFTVHVYCEMLTPRNIVTPRPEHRASVDVARRALPAAYE